MCRIFSRLVVEAWVFPKCKSIFSEFCVCVCACVCLGGRQPFNVFDRHLHEVVRVGKRDVVAEVLAPLYNPFS